MKLFLIVLFLIPALTHAQAGKKEVYNKDFDWTITLPENFDTVSAAEWARLQNRGADAIEKTYGQEVENNAKVIFVFKSSQFNYFESNYQPFDPAKDGDYLESFRNVNNILYGTFEAQMTDARLDSSYSTETISGLVFQTFRVTITLPNQMVLDFLMYSRLFGNREFTVNIMTLDKQQQKLLLDAWKNSRFGSK